MELEGAARRATPTARPERKSPVYQRALPYRSRAWPGTPDSHPLWRPQAMAVLSGSAPGPFLQDRTCNLYERCTLVNAANRFVRCTVGQTWTKGQRRAAVQQARVNARPGVTGPAGTRPAVGVYGHSAAEPTTPQHSSRTSRDGFTAPVLWAGTRVGSFGAPVNG